MCGILDAAEAEESIGTADGELEEPEGGSECITSAEAGESAVPESERSR